MRAPRPDSTGAGSPAASNTLASGAVRLPRWVFPLVTLASLLLGVTSIVRSTRLVTTAADSDLTNFFLRSADYILRGNPWHMYAVRADLTYPNFNPPLSMFLLAPLLGMARALGFSANYGEQITFVTLPFVFLVPLMGYLGLRIMRELYPEAPETLRLMLYGFITLSPLTWQSYSIWYHVEQPLMLCFLLAAALALQRQRPWLAGTLAGLAFLTRTTALIPLIAVGILLLMTREWRPLLKFGGLSAAVAAIGFAPFILFDATDMKYTFLSWRGSALIGSDSIWTIFAYTGNNHLLALLDAAAKRLDTYSVIAVVAVAAFFAARRLGLTVASRDLWALLAIAMLATPMLSKQVWPYYYLEPVVFLVVWELSTVQDRVAGVWRWPVLSIGFTLVAATLSPYIGLKSVGRLDALTLGITQTALMAGFTLAVWARMRARKPSASEVNVGPAESAGMQPMTPPGIAAAGMGQFSSGALGTPARPQQSAPVTPPGVPARPSPQSPYPQQPQPGPQRSQQQNPFGAEQPSPAWPVMPPMPPLTPPAQGQPGATTPRGAPPNPQQPGSNPLNNPWRPQDNGMSGMSGTPGAALRGSAQNWRGPSPSSQAGAPPAPEPPAFLAPRDPNGPNQASPFAPMPEQQAKGEGGLDPWRDWPNRR